MTARMTLVHVLAAIRSRCEASADGPVSTGKPTEALWLPGKPLLAALRTGCAHAEAAAVLFGEGDASGALSLTDQSAILIPVRSCRGVFAWTTSPLLLHRFLRDADTAGLEAPRYVPDPGIESSCLVGYEALKTLAANGKTVLEDLDLDARGDAGVTAWGQWFGRYLYPDEEADSDFWRATLSERLCVVHNDVLTFLADRAAATSGQAGAPGVVGEEPQTEAAAVPAETVLWGSAVAREATVNSAALGPDGVLRTFAGLVGCAVAVWPEDGGIPGVCRLRILGERQ
jgi:CRISPR-associated protein Cmr4